MESTVTAKRSEENLSQGVLAAPVGCKMMYRKSWKVVEVRPGKAR